MSDRIVSIDLGIVLPNPHNKPEAEIARELRQLMVDINKLVTDHEGVMMPGNAYQEVQAMVNAMDSSGETIRITRDELLNGEGER